MHAVALSHDGNKVLTGNADYTLRLYDYVTGVVACGRILALSPSFRPNPSMSAGALSRAASCQRGHGAYGARGMLSKCVEPLSNAVPGAMKGGPEGRSQLLLFLLCSRGVLKGRDFFFLLRTALKDRPKGPPTANRQLPSTANRHQPPTTNRHQPPATNRRQPPAATNRQLPTTANRLQPPTASHQPPPTASCQLPTANCRQSPTANCHQPWLSTWSARGLFWENWYRNTFFFSVKDTPALQ